MERVVRITCSSSRITEQADRTISSRMGITARIKGMVTKETIEEVVNMIAELAVSLTIEVNNIQVIKETHTIIEGTHHRMTTEDKMIGENLTALETTSIRTIEDSLTIKVHLHTIKDSHLNTIRVNHLKTSGERIKEVTTGKTNRTRISGARISSSSNLRMVALHVAVMLVISKVTQMTHEVILEATMKTSNIHLVTCHLISSPKTKTIPRSKNRKSPRLKL